MLFYADKLHPLLPQETKNRVLEGLAHTAELYRRYSPSLHPAALRSHSELVGAAIALGELHQALSDRLNPAVDDAFTETDRLASAGILLGRLVYRSARLLGLCWEAPGGAIGAGRAGACPPPPGRRQGEQGGRAQGPALRHSPATCSAAELVDLLQQAADAVAGIELKAIGEPVEASVPEGYAFYSLYPEMYLAGLAKALRSEPTHPSYTVLGIRSIGCSLATLVAGALQEVGLTARVETIRPRGHPFDRYVEMAPTLQKRLEEDARKGAGFMIVDEGPGLTCSSFLSVCSALSRLGAEEERLTILSAWRGAPSIYASEEGRGRWQRLRVFWANAAEAFDGWRYLVPFLEQALGIPSSASRRHQPLPQIRDFSYGRWRERCCSSLASWPVVHRATERTKLLFEFPPFSPLPLGEGQVEGSSCDRQRGEAQSRPSPDLTSLDGSQAKRQYLLKFAGLGGYGRQKLERARVLATAGFSPAVEGLAYGFLVYRFVTEARPMEAREMSPSLLSRLVEYYAFLARSFPAPLAPSFDRLAEMVRVNSSEALGLDASRFLAYWSPWREAIDRRPRALIDGKPQPHEWLWVVSTNGSPFIKTDSSDHFQDHTLVGEQNILWDLAGACEEWVMDKDNVCRLLQLWEESTGDPEAATLLPFYRAAYLAFRLAALHYAVHSTDEEEIRRSLQHQQWNYRQRLADLLNVHGSPEEIADAPNSDCR